MPPQPLVRSLLLCLLLVAIALLGCGGSGSGDSGGSGDGGDPDPSSPLGINVSSADYWSSQLMFVDAFKQSGDWVTQNEKWVDDGANPWDSGVIDQIPQDADGYPLSLPAVGIPGTEGPQVVATALFRSIDGQHPTGTFICLYDGSGSLEFELDASVISAAPGRIEVDVTGNGDGVLVRIVQSQPGDHVRNIRFIMPGFEATYASEPFHPQFLEWMKEFKVLRFMDLQKTIGSPNQAWAERTTTTHHTQTRAEGVAVEYLVDLANALQADAWFCVPHLADDDWVTQLATLVRDRLDPGLRVYVEYSNEIWNDSFPQGSYVEQKGLDLGLSGSPFEARLRYQAQRSLEIFGIFESVFGGASRLVRVLASQAANTWVSTTILDWNDAHRQADALAIAPYFGGYLGDPATQDSVAGWTVEQLLDACETEITGRIDTRMTDQAAVAVGLGVDLIAYEGGQHLVGYAGAENNDDLNALFDAANSHPRMRTLYALYHDQWRARGGRMFVPYTSIEKDSKWGRWGFAQYQDQDPTTAPKYLALMEFIASNPKWW